MSLPSDVNPDVAEAVERLAPAGPERPRNNLTDQQLGLVAAALAAFLGIAYFGPMITRLTRPKPLRARMAQRMADAKTRARTLGRRTTRTAQGTAKRTAKRLGGGGIWR